MDEIKITTSQNVSLSYTAAGVGPRMLAAILDSYFYLCLCHHSYLYFYVYYSPQRIQWRLRQL